MRGLNPLKCLKYLRRASTGGKVSLVKIGLLCLIAWAVFALFFVGKTTTHLKEESGSGTESTRENDPNGVDQRYLLENVVMGVKQMGKDINNIVNELRYGDGKGKEAGKDSIVEVDVKGEGVVGGDTAEKSHNANAGGAGINVGADDRTSKVVAIHENGMAENHIGVKEVNKVSEKEVEKVPSNEIRSPGGDISKGNNEEKELQKVEQLAKLASISSVSARNFQSSTSAVAYAASQEAQRKELSMKEQMIKQAQEAELLKKEEEQARLKEDIMNKKKLRAKQRKRKPLQNPEQQKQQQQQQQQLLPQGLQPNPANFDPKNNPPPFPAPPAIPEPAPPAPALEPVEPGVLPLYRSIFNVGARIYNETRVATRAIYTKQLLHTMAKERNAASSAAANKLLSNPMNFDSLFESPQLAALSDSMYEQILNFQRRFQSVAELLNDKSASSFARLRFSATAMSDMITLARSMRYQVAQQILDTEDALDAATKSLTEMGTSGAQLVCNDFPLYVPPIFYKEEDESKASSRKPANIISELAGKFPLHDNTTSTISYTVEQKLEAYLPHFFIAIITSASEPAAIERRAVIRTSPWYTNLVQMGAEIKFFALSSSYVSTGSDIKTSCDAKAMLDLDQGYLPCDLIILRDPASTISHALATKFPSKYSYQCMVPKTPPEPAVIVRERGTFLLLETLHWVSTNRKYNWFLKLEDAVTDVDLKLAFNTFAQRNMHFPHKRAVIGFQVAKAYATSRSANMHDSRYASRVKNDQYPRFPNGAGFIITQDVVNAIVAMSINTPFEMYLRDDASLGVWITPLNITRLHAPFVSVSC